MTDHRGVEPVRRRSRGGSWTTWLAIFLVLGALVAVGDRVAAQAAARELQGRVEQELVARQVSYSSLAVQVGGVPFLTQVAAGRYDEITIDMTNVQLPPETGRGATLPALHVVATGVTADTAELVQGTASVMAETVTGTAVVSYQTLSELIDLSAYQLSALTFGAENGAVSAQASATVAGVSIPLRALADVSVSDGVIEIRLRDATAIGVTVPQVATDIIDDLVNQAIVTRLPPLPFGLTVVDVAVRTEGLAITATAREVPLAG